ncbi:MAG: OB-fold nucleic acid binding domain-containing protein [Mycobacteriales bacterium]
MLTGIDEAQVLEATLTMPYTLTTGRAAGSFLAELANHRILGSRCEECARLMAPAQDYCGRCGTQTEGFVTMPETGTVTALTRTQKGALAFIRLDGADTDLLHRLADGGAGLDVGSRVRAVWAISTTQSMLDLDCFGPDTSGDAAGSPAEAGEVDVVIELPYALELAYRHSYGPHYGRLFDELASRQRILGSLCPRCRNVLVPPREFCDACFVRTAQHVEVSDSGALQAFSVIHMEFIGQTRKPPYVYAEIVLAGSATRLIHTVAGFDVATAADRLKIGMTVRAVWKDPADCVGTLNDIDYFEPVFEPEA